MADNIEPFSGFFQNFINIGLQFRHNPQEGRVCSDDTAEPRKFRYQGFIGTCFPETLDSLIDPLPSLEKCSLPGQKVRES